MSNSTTSSYCTPSLGTERGVRAPLMNLSTPLADRIRQQILKSDEPAKLSGRALGAAPRSTLSRKEALIRSSQRIRVQQPNQSHITPIASHSSSFFSPSPAKVDKAFKRTPRLGPPQRIAHTPPPPPTEMTPKRTDTVVAATPTPYKTPLVTQDEADEVSTRRNLDKRSARLIYSQSFQARISQARSPSSLDSSAVMDAIHSPSSDGVSVLVRKRPIFEKELQLGDFDVVDVSSNGVVVYKTFMQCDMKTMAVQPVSMSCTSAFDDTVDSNVLYNKSVKSLVDKAIGGHVVTLLMFGATGSGKTFTMTAIEGRIGHDLFDAVDSIELQYVELSGKVCRDLLNAGSEAVRIVDHRDGYTQFLGTKSVKLSSPDEFYQVLAEAKALRKTHETDRNSVSSRSHAICQITLPQDTPRRRVVNLVDCAGTERRYDSMYHSRTRQAESVEINASLYALKECIRARTKRSAGKEVHVPYRTSTLTRILRESFEGEDSHLAVIATVAPTATDTEHTLQTLETVSSLIGGELHAGNVDTFVSTPSTPSRSAVAPKCWNHDDLLKFLRDKRFSVTKNVPESMDGKRIMRMSKLQLRYAFFRDDDTEAADRLYNSLRAESDRVARIELKRRVSISKAHRSVQ